MIVPQTFNGTNGHNIHCLVSGAFTTHSTSNYAQFSSISTATATVGARFNASLSNSIYFDSGKVYPLSLALNFIIKS